MMVINYHSLLHSIILTEDMPVVMRASLLNPVYTQLEWCDSASQATFRRGDRAMSL